MLVGLTYESIMATLTESFPWIKGHNGPSSECPEGRQNGASPEQQDTSLQAPEDTNTPENLGSQVGNPSTAPQHTHTNATPASETLAPHSPAKDTAEATRKLTHTFLTSKESERAAASPANTSAALHSTYGPSQPGSEPEKARQPGENLVRVMRLGNVINETSAPEATAGQEASLSPANLPARLSACLAPRSPPSIQPLQGFSVPCSYRPSTPCNFPQPSSSLSSHPVILLYPSTSQSSLRPSTSHHGSSPLLSTGRSSLHSPRPSSPRDQCFSFHTPHNSFSPRPVSPCITHALSPCIPLSICSSPRITEPPSAHPGKSAALQPCGSSSLATLSPCISQHSHPATPQPHDSSAQGSTPRFVSLSTVTLDSSVEVLEEESDGEVGVVVEGEKSSGELQKQGSSEIFLVDLTSPARDPSSDPSCDSDDLTG
ncbi:hypothetical protein E2C01_063778 [Portunus trituberculatus]|uniref:Uncharacterized protein n=2 Tax=Portunus trituberculatus TaxID=210409 RepID=A0A5B7HBE1_PORTR|nr:hypothetical protein [Portunus trituberculatus]